VKLRRWKQVREAILFLGFMITGIPAGNGDVFYDCMLMVVLSFDIYMAEK